MVVLQERQVKENGEQRMSLLCKNIYIDIIQKKTHSDCLRKRLINKKATSAFQDKQNTNKLS